ncbi:MAG: sulfurtransferase [candidate division NC10 bacterium]|nr:sulfurtransferase [candidate division NC10 bacterium]
MSSPYNITLLAETDWLEEHLNDAEIRIVDLRYRPRGSGDRWVIGDDRAAYEAGHVPGAVFAESTRGFVAPRDDGTMPVAPPGQFAEFASRFGVGPDTLVVLYDDLPVPVAAARLWWTFRYYGHDRVKVLNGGFRKWRAEGRPLSTDVPSYAPVAFVPRVRSHLRATKETLRAALGAPGTVIVDCMPSDMHAGQTPRPWGARLGHIPGAVSVPWLTNVLPEEVAASNEARRRALAGDEVYSYRPAEELQRMYQTKGVTREKRVVTYCDLGYAAANGAFVLALLGYEDIVVYDASFSEWSRDENLPVESSIRH